MLGLPQYSEELYDEDCPDGIIGLSDRITDSQSGPHFADAVLIAETDESTICLNRL